MYQGVHKTFLHYHFHETGKILIKNIKRILFTLFLPHNLTLKRLGGQFDTPCGFSKNVSSKERAKPWFFVTFNIIIRHIFPENFIEIPQFVQKI